MSAEVTNRLDRPVDSESDHVLGPPHAQIILVEYGGYACPHCRAANERIAEVRDQFGDRLRYVFRHRPLTDNDLALRAAELVERADSPEQFWKAHIALMTRSASLTEQDLTAVAAELGLPAPDSATGREAARRAEARVAADIRSAHASGVVLTLTFFINGRRYDGPWDEVSFTDAMLGSFGHRVRAAALAAIMLGLVIGKPVGMLFASMLAVRFGLAIKPGEYSWAQVAGAGALSGIGFTMSLFIASQAFPLEGDFAAAKIAVFTASLVSAVIGVAILWRAGANKVGEINAPRAVHAPK
ncbi:MAG: Na+/H+ antiporter NhaA [Gammaproteobacteria bacterium]|nr:Na+/H+ antiporter NhaA [Gammaproteobacteria bacterium]